MKGGKIREEKSSLWAGLLTVMEMGTFGCGGQDRGGVAVPHRVSRVGDVAF